MKKIFISAISLIVSQSLLAMPYGVLNSKKFAPNYSAVALYKCEIQGQKTASGCKPVNRLQNYLGDKLVLDPGDYVFEFSHNYSPVFTIEADKMTVVDFPIYKAKQDLEARYDLKNDFQRNQLEEWVWASRANRAFVYSFAGQLDGTSPLSICFESAVYNDNQPLSIKLQPAGQALCDKLIDIGYENLTKENFVPVFLDWQNLRNYAFQVYEYPKVDIYKTSKGEYSITPLYFIQHLDAGQTVPLFPGVYKMVYDSGTDFEDVSVGIEDFKITVVD